MRNQRLYGRKPVFTWNEGRRKRTDEFETLLIRSRTAVERWLIAHMGNRADAEDVLQETCVAAFRGFGELQNRASFLPWILGIAKRKCADWYRAQARNRTVLMENVPDRAEDETCDFAVEETLDALNERDRLMLQLFYKEMLSQKQISDLLRIPEGTVKSRMNAARARFRAAYPYPPGGGIIVENTKKQILPEKLPEYSIARKKDKPFSVACEELPGWFIVPHLGERMVWGMYDLPSGKLDISYDMSVVGPASVHGLEGVAIKAKVLPPQANLADGDPMRDAVSASSGGQEEWTFIAQEKDGYTRFLSAEHVNHGVRTLTTFLDGEAFMDNWGYGEDNCGTPVRREALGKIVRNGNAVTAAEKGILADIVGSCDLTLDGRVYDTVCFMELEMLGEGVASEQYLTRDGHTVLWRRFNRDDWKIDRYGKRWSELLPENEPLFINGQKFVHWYDCLCIR